MNLTFFQAAMGVYLLAAAGYIAYIVKPEQKWTATTSLWITFLGFLFHIAYFMFPVDRIGPHPHHQFL